MFETSWTQKSERHRKDVCMHSDSRAVSVKSISALPYTYRVTDFAWWVEFVKCVGYDCFIYMDSILPFPTRDTAILVLVFNMTIEEVDVITYPNSVYLPHINRLVSLFDWRGAV